MCLTDAEGVFLRVTAITSTPTEDPIRTTFVPGISIMPPIVADPVDTAVVAPVPALALAQEADGLVAARKILLAFPAVGAKKDKQQNNRKVSHLPVIFINFTTCWRKGLCHLMREIVVC